MPGRDAREPSGQVGLNDLKVNVFGCPNVVRMPEQIGVFLDRAAAHRLYALYHLIAFRGLRRGEAWGLRWADVDLDEGTTRVC